MVVALAFAMVSRSALDRAPWPAAGGGERRGCSRRMFGERCGVPSPPPLEPVRLRADVLRFPSCATRCGGGEVEELASFVALTTSALRSFAVVTGMPGGMLGSLNLRDCKVLEKMVKKHDENGGLYGAICAAPAVTLADWGMLKGLKFTAEVIPVNSRVVADRNVVTSQGSGIAIEFALALVEQLYAKEKMEEVVRPLYVRPQHGAEYTIEELNSLEWKCSGTPQPIFLKCTQQLTVAQIYASNGQKLDPTTMQVRLKRYQEMRRADGRTMEEIVRIACILELIRKKNTI